MFGLVSGLAVSEVVFVAGLVSGSVVSLSMLSSAFTATSAAKD